MNHPTIAAAVGAQVYNQQAPETARHPFLIIDLNAGRSDNTSATRYVDLRYLVKAVTTNGDDSGNAAEMAAELAAAIYEALHGRDFTLDGEWNLVRCQHQTVVSFVENRERRQCWHAGGLYRIRAYGGDL